MTKHVPQRGLTFSSDKLSDEMVYRIRILHEFDPDQPKYELTHRYILNQAVPLSAADQTIAKWTTVLKGHEHNVDKVNFIELTLRLALSQRFKSLSDECLKGITPEIYKLHGIFIAQLGLNPLAEPYQHDGSITAAFGRAASGSSNYGKTKDLSQDITSAASFAQKRNVPVVSEKPSLRQHGDILVQAKTASAIMSPTSDKASTGSSAWEETTAKEVPESKDTINHEPKFTIDKDHESTNGVKEHDTEKVTEHQVNKSKVDTETVKADLATEIKAESVNDSKSVTEHSSNPKFDTETAEANLAMNTATESDHGTKHATKHANEPEADAETAKANPAMKTKTDSDDGDASKDHASEEQRMSPKPTSENGLKSDDEVKKKGSSVSRLEMSSNKFLQTINGNRVAKFMHSRYRPTVAVDDNAVIGITLGAEGDLLTFDYLHRNVADEVQILSIEETLPWLERHVLVAMFYTFENTFKLFRKVVFGETNTGEYFAVFDGNVVLESTELCIMGPPAGPGRNGYFAKVRRVMKGTCDRCCYRTLDGQLCRHVQLVRLYDQDEVSLLD